MTDRPAPNRPLVGIAWMLATTLCFVLVNIIVHWLGARVPAVQSAFVRFVWGTLFFAPALVQILRRSYPRKVWALFGLRGVLHAIAVGLWFYAMAHIPIADVTAINYLNPIVVTVGGAVLLGEGLAWRRITAVIVALLGALIILRPGLREIEPGHLAQLGAALFFGATYLVAKRLTDFVPAGTVVAMMSLSVALCLAPVAIWNWQPITLSETLWLAAVAVFATGGHYAMTHAFAAAPVTVTQPVLFLQLVWAAIAGWSLFGEVPDPFTMLGGGIIIACVSFMTWRESRLKGGPVTPPAPATKI
ncbi:peptide ABC transporter permease [Thioclava dalianensis]|uniref:Peptide ABC transporter permease n=1 Tax=Thioclava dalianensis TaxID=1185766 RepID=A0A074U821_9RHOB|nr:DMT family transporter [Thioclava dalianensis]KEP70812.1 peptide ABC transporter permease [Thioclava dalianensis]